MAGNLIFKFEIISPGMEDENHNHLPSKPHTAWNGCGEGREAIIILFLFSKPYHSLSNIPTDFRMSMQRSCTFFIPCKVLRGENTEESKKTQPSLEYSSDSCSQMGSQTSQQDTVMHYQQGTTFHVH